ncbi:MAG TPA: hypothetical protein VHG30_05435 [Microvirga sp.]|nr:hypothetical protein [Microvirga sp.]
MPRSIKTAQGIVDEAQSLLSINLVTELAEPLARYMLASYADEEWRDSPQVEALGRVAALFEAHGREIPTPILEALKKAAEAGRPVGLA